MERPTGKKTQLVSGTTMEQYVIKKKILTTIFNTTITTVDIEGNMTSTLPHPTDKIGYQIRNKS